MCCSWWVHGCMGAVSGITSVLHVCVCVCVCVHGSQTQSGSTALMYAAWGGRTEIVQALIAGGADMNLQVC